MTTCYLDTSALVKLVAPEPETDALRSWLASEDRTIVTSALTQVELLRAAGRHSPSATDVATAVVERIDLIAITTDILGAAARLAPTSLRTLDAIHLATAIAIRSDLSQFVAYDRRLLDAAINAGLPTVTPGR